MSIIVLYLVHILLSFPVSLLECLLIEVSRVSSILPVNKEKLCLTYSGLVNIYSPDKITANYLIEIINILNTL